MHPRWLLVPLFLALGLPAHGYFDPGSGSMLLQLILGGVAGLAVAIKMYWHKLLGLFGRRSEPRDP